MHNISEKLNWFPKELTSNILGVILAILSGIVINLITGSFPSDECLFLFSLFSILCFILGLISSLILLLIRTEIDNLLQKKVLDNEIVDVVKKLSPPLLWEITISEIYELSCTKFAYFEWLRSKMYQTKFEKFKFWKWTGIISLSIGLLLMIYVNIMNRADNRNHENQLLDGIFATVNSYDSMNIELIQQKIQILQLSDSIQNIRQEINFLNAMSNEKDKPLTDNEYSGDTDPPFQAY